VALIRSEGHEVFASMLERCLDGDGDGFTAYVRSYFKGEPAWKFGNKSMSHLLYTLMGCPIKVRGKATDNMRAKGIYEGSPKADSAAIAYALIDMQEDEEICNVLRSLRLMELVLPLEDRQGSCVTHASEYCDSPRFGIETQQTADWQV
jgi:glutaredoxin